MATISLLGRLLRQTFTRHHNAITRHVFVYPSIFALTTSYNQKHRSTLCQASNGDDSENDILANIKQKFQEINSVDDVMMMASSQMDAVIASGTPIKISYGAGCGFCSGTYSVFKHGEKNHTLKNW